MKLWPIAAVAFLASPVQAELVLWRNSDYQGFKPLADLHEANQWERQYEEQQEEMARALIWRELAKDYPKPVMKPVASKSPKLDKSGRQLKMRRKLPIDNSAPPVFVPGG